MDIFRQESRKDAHRVAYEEPLYTLSELYHEASKIDQGTTLGYRRHLARVMETEFFLRLMARPCKTYPTRPAIDLPEANESSDSSLCGSLRQVVLKRRSTRDFAGGPLPLSSIAAILA